MKLLIVEDDSLMGQALQIGLRSVGFQCDCVATAKAAVAVLRLTTYRLVLLDAHLPLHGASTVVACCRGLARPIPVLVMVERDSRDGEVETADWRGDGVLVKPVDLSDLDRAIRQLINAFANLPPS